MQIVCQYTQANVAFVASKAFVRAAIQSVAFQTVDVALHCAVGILAFTPEWGVFALPVSLTATAFLGQDHFRYVQFQQFPVFLTAKAFVKADALQILFAVTVFRFALIASEISLIIGGFFQVVLWL